MNAVLRTVGWVTLIILAVVGVSTMARLILGRYLPLQQISAHELTYTDFLTVTLTALCALLAALAILLAMAAFVGYKDLRSAIITESKESARIAVEKAVSEQAQFIQGMATKASLNLAVTENARQVAEENVTNLSRHVQSETQGGADESKIADDKPRRKPRITKPAKPKRD